MLVRLLVTWGFPAAVLGGISYAFARTRWQKAVCLLSILPPVLFSVLNAWRANTLIAVILWLTSYSAMKLAVQGSVRRMGSKKIVLRVCLAAAIALSFAFAIDAVRSNQAEAVLPSSLNWPSMKANLFGHLPVFTYWADHRDKFSSNLSFGAYTFGGITDVVGGLHRKEGVYDDFIDLDKDSGQNSNLYTAFRGMVEDFSFPGALGFLFFLGLVGGYSHRKVVSGNHAWVPLLVLYYAYLVWTPVISLLNYNGPVLAVVVGWVMLTKTKTKERLCAS